VGPPVVTYSVKTVRIYLHMQSSDSNSFQGISEYLLADGLDVWVNTAGTSMYPVICSGDRIIVSPDKKPILKDIIVFKRNDMMICHRVTKIFEKDGTKYFQTRGDSFCGLDEPTTADQILGKVIKIERENASLPRRVLLFIFPALRFGRLNAFVISALIRIRNIFSL
jgi:signal peptidase I